MHRLLRYVFFFLAPVFFAMIGQTVCAEDLMDIYHLAQENNPILQRARYENLASQERVKQAYAGLLPTVSLDAESGSTRQNIIRSDNTFYSPGISTFVSHRLSLTLTQPVLRMSSFAQLRQAKAEVRRSDLEFETTRQGLMLRIATLYFDALAAQDALMFSQAEKAAVELHFALVQAQKARGLVAITDLYDASARLASVDATVMESEDLWDDALQALREASRETTLDLARLVKELDLVTPQPANVARWIDAALEQNPALKAQQAAVEVARQELARQKSGRYPALDLVARGNRERTGGTLFGGGSDIETANVQLRLNMPLYQGGFTRSRIREAGYLYQSALQELTRQKRELTRQTRGAYFGVIRAISRVAALAQVVVSQELALEARQDGFKSGRFSSLEVLDAERDLFQARRDYARARYDYILDSLRLRQAVGTLNETDLLAVNQWLD